VEVSALGATRNRFMDDWGRIHNVVEDAAFTHSIRAFPGKGAGVGERHCDA